MRRLVYCLLLLGCCARPRTDAREPGAWLLVHPPEREDVDAPRGVRLHPKAPLGEWSEAGAFASEGECVETRDQRVVAAAERARAVHGDEAKYDLELRRAVNARCVPVARRQAPGE